jgi:hypothetical protein
MSARGPLLRLDTCSAQPLMRALQGPATPIRKVLQVRGGSGHDVVSPRGRIVESGDRSKSPKHPHQDYPQKLSSRNGRRGRDLVVELDLTGRPPVGIDMESW